MATEIKVGLAGFGNVGKGTYDILERNHSLIRQRAGAPISVKRVTVRNVDRVKLLVDEDVIVTNDWHDLVNDPEVNVVVEAMGGIEPAKSLILAAIDAGKHVVTANKALLAEHGNEIFSAAQAKGVNVAFEAAVAGSIPIVKALREGLAANRVSSIAGIINGTCNFILSTMRDTGRSFDDVLKEAQRLGYAEADPTFDIEGTDSAHKLMLLSAIAFRSICLKFISKALHIWKPKTLSLPKNSATASSCLASPSTPITASNFASIRRLFPHAACSPM